MRSKWFLSTWFLISGICLIIAGIASAIAQLEPPKVPTTNERFITIEHDDHKWVVYRGVHFQHHPDCECQQ